MPVTEVRQLLVVARVSTPADATRAADALRAVGLAAHALPRRRRLADRLLGRPAAISLGVEPRDADRARAVLAAAGFGARVVA